jgi:hypothetical protein
MHGHGAKPYLCTYEGCDRSVAGNGFPRHWNLRDHMRRVHNDSGVTRSNASGSPTPSMPSARPGKGGAKKRKSEIVNSGKVKKSQVGSPVIQRPATPQEPGLVQQWELRHQQLAALLQQVQDPRDPRTLEALHKAGEYISILKGTTQAVLAAPKPR